MDMHHDEMSADKRHMRLEWRNHMLMRVLIGLIVLIFTFWCGMQLGELRSAVGLAHGGPERAWNGNMMYTTGSSGTVQMHTMIPAGTTTITPATGATTQAAQ